MTSKRTSLRPCRPVVPEASELLGRLRQATAELSALYAEQATTRESLLREKLRLSETIEAPSIAALDREIQTQTADLEATLIRIGGQIAAYKEEKDYLLAYLGAS